MSNPFGMTPGRLAEMNAILFGDPFAEDAVDKAVQARRTAEDRELDARAAEAKATRSSGHPSRPARPRAR